MSIDEALAEKQCKILFRKCEKNLEILKKLWLGFEVKQCLFRTLHSNLNGSKRNNESKTILESLVWFEKGCLEGWES
jgi:hypothetical protein